MAEHLATIRQYVGQPAPAPAGIINFPAENGIDPALPPEVILVEATTMALGNVAVSMSTPLNKATGSIPYSELRGENTLDEVSATLKDSQMAKEQATLEDAQDNGINPALRDPAQAILDTRSPRNAHNTPFIAKAQAELHQLQDKAKRGGTMTLADQQRITVLEGEIKLAEKANSNPLKRRKTRKRDRLARRSMVQAGYSEERISSIMDTRGEVTPVLQRTSREIKRRSGVEDKETRNQVGKIGKVIVGPDNRRYVVKDVESQPAQGFKVIGYKPHKPGAKAHELGDPIFEPGLDASGNQLPQTLHELYIKVGNEYKLAPRDDPYLSRQVRQGGDDGRFYLMDENDSPVLADPDGIKDDSFSPIDDVVILQKLYTAAEAVQMIVEGSGVDLSDWAIRIGDLTQYVEDKVVKLVRDSHRELDKHLVFAPSDEVIDPNYEVAYPGRSINDPKNMRPKSGLETGILPPYDLSSDPDPHSGESRKRPSGHFRRFDIAQENTHDVNGNPYLDNQGRPSPRTSRQIAQEEHLMRVGSARVAATLARPLAGRGKSIPSR